MRRILLGATPAVFWLAITHAAAQQAITTPILASDPNFRDLAGIAAIYGGAGFADVTAHDGVMRTGVFYRSEALNALIDPDFATLSSLHITLDIDLRTPGEINPPPPKPSAEDRVPTGATWVNINIYGTPFDPDPFAPPAPYPTPTTQAEAEADFATGYVAFVTPGSGEPAAFGAVLLDLAHSDGAVLYHCAGGKDRTGWTSFLLQTIAGVDMATRMQDYLATNAYTSAQIVSQYNQLVASEGVVAANILYPLLGVRSSFLQAAIDQISLSYPAATFDASMHAYLTQGLGLTQADIYVLRAKMVDFLTLPGQSGFVGNAASGAALLNALQNSPLSGAYTAFNSYLQSAIDAGTLGGVEAQVGGQVRADAAAYLLRQPFRLDAALAPSVDARDLAPGQGRVWTTGLAGAFATDAHGGAASSWERSAGQLIGATYRIDARSSAFVAVGYDWSAVGSAGATANLGVAIGAAGGRYAFGSLEQGLYVDARAYLGSVDYDGSRPLSGGLGAARGGGGGATYSGQAMLGDVIRLSGVAITPQAGVRVAHVALNGFQESGGELALNLRRLDHTTPSLLAGVEVAFDPWTRGGWTITPTIPLQAELTLGDAKVSSVGRLYGLNVSQSAGYDSRILVQGGLSVSAQRGAFEVKAAANAALGAASASLNGQLTVAYRF